jgi:hypothetical protein
MDQEQPNAWMSIHASRDARSISDRLPRPRPSAVDVSGNRCIHVKQSASSLASDREACGAPVEEGTPNGWNCWYHGRLIHGLLPKIEGVDRAEGRVLIPAGE